ncbi:hypothetical protein [Streptomyces sp. NBC_01794]|uniref:hypothetical protein n=1 Tax=Streptomyces sp. NBC_01794 TaxID=2975942 RepID=UPI00308F0A92|nr:hypothetical protein OIE54_06900 [Streptomyces sp. NBC_01794]
MTAPPPLPWLQSWVGRTGSRRLLLTAQQHAGGVHHAMVTNGATVPSPALLKGPQDELAAWAAGRTWS